MNLPSFETYCPNTTGHNALQFDLGSGFLVWFSYRTPVAFHAPGTSTIVRENEWGPTTGKHLNSIDGGSAPAKKLRLDGEAFQSALQVALNPPGDSDRECLQLCDIHCSAPDPDWSGA